MNGFFRRILLSLTALLAAGAARADEASFEINTPLIVTAGEMFRVEFVLEGKADDDSTFWRAPPSRRGTSTRTSTARAARRRP